MKKYKCCICGKEDFGWGNNPWPVVKDEDARCCDSCNNMYVIPTRLGEIIVVKEEAEDEQRPTK